MSKRPSNNEWPNPCNNYDNPNLIIIPTVPFCNASQKKIKLNCDVITKPQTRHEEQNFRFSAPQLIEVVTQSNSFQNGISTGKSNISIKESTITKTEETCDTNKGSWASNYLSSIGYVDPVKLNLLLKKNFKKKSLLKNTNTLLNPNMNDSNKKSIHHIEQTGSKREDNKYKFKKDTGNHSNNSQTKANMNSEIPSKSCSNMKQEHKIENSTIVKKDSNINKNKISQDKTQCFNSENIKSKHTVKPLIPTKGSSIKQDYKNTYMNVEKYKQRKEYGNNKKSINKNDVISKNVLKTKSFIDCLNVKHDYRSKQQIKKILKHKTGERDRYQDKDRVLKSTVGKLKHTKETYNTYMKKKADEENVRSKPSICKKRRASTTSSEKHLKCKSKTDNNNAKKKCIKIKTPERWESQEKSPINKVSNINSKGSLSSPTNSAIHKENLNRVSSIPQLEENDLRKKLMNKPSKSLSQYFTTVQNCTTTCNGKFEVEERENLTITIDNEYRDTHKDVNDGSKSPSSNIDCSSKIKYTQIKLLIKLKCGDTGDEEDGILDDSSSLNSEDVSFLDDINIDEIVESFHNPKDICHSNKKEMPYNSCLESNQESISIQASKKTEIINNNKADIINNENGVKSKENTNNMAKEGCNQNIISNLKESDDSLNNVPKNNDSVSVIMKCLELPAWVKSQNTYNVNENTREVSTNNYNVNIINKGLTDNVYLETIDLTEEVFPISSREQDSFCSKVSGDINAVSKNINGIDNHVVKTTMPTNNMTVNRLGYLDNTLPVQDKLDYSHDWRHNIEKNNESAQSTNAKCEDKASNNMVIIDLTKDQDTASNKIYIERYTKDLKSNDRDDNVDVLIDLSKDSLSELTDVSSCNVKYGVIKETVNGDKHTAAPTEADFTKINNIEKYTNDELSQKYDNLITINACNVKDIKQIAQDDESSAAPTKTDLKKLYNPEIDKKEVEALGNREIKEVKENKYSEKLTETNCIEVDKTQIATKIEHSMLQIFNSAAQANSKLENNTIHHLPKDNRQSNQILIEKSLVDIEKTEFCNKCATREFVCSNCVTGNLLDILEQPSTASQRVNDISEDVLSVINRNNPRQDAVINIPPTTYKTEQDKKNPIAKSMVELLNDYTIDMSKNNSNLKKYGESRATPSTNGNTKKVIAKVSNSSTAAILKTESSNVKKDLAKESKTKTTVNLSIRNGNTKKVLAKESSTGTAAILKTESNNVKKDLAKESKTKTVNLNTSNGNTKKVHAKESNTSTAAILKTESSNVKKDLAKESKTKTTVNLSTSDGNTKKVLAKKGNTNTTLKTIPPITKLHTSFSTPLRTDNRNIKKYLTKESIASTAATLRTDNTDIKKYIINKSNTSTTLGRHNSNAKTDLGKESKTSTATTSRTDNSNIKVTANKSNTSSNPTTPKTQLHKRAILSTDTKNIKAVLAKKSKTSTADPFRTNNSNVKTDLDNDSKTSTAATSRTENSNIKNIVNKSNTSTKSTTTPKTKLHTCGIVCSDNSNMKTDLAKESITAATVSTNEAIVKTDLAIKPKTSTTTLRTENIVYKSNTTTKPTTTLTTQLHSNATLSADNKDVKKDISKESKISPAATLSTNNGDVKKCLAKEADTSITANLSKNNGNVKKGSTNVSNSSTAATRTGNTNMKKVNAKKPKTSTAATLCSNVKTGFSGSYGGRHNINRFKLPVNMEERELIKILEMQERKFNGEKLTVHTLCYRGQFSTIFRVRDSKKCYVVKVVSNNNEVWHNGEFWKHKQVAKRIQYDCLSTENGKNYCVYIHKSFPLLDRWCCFMDFYPKNLSQALMENNNPFHIDLVQELSKQLISAVLALKQNQIVHSDIKPGHILLNSLNNRLKLCGFDEAFALDLGAPCQELRSSVNYRAPELIMGYSTGATIDVWSTGCVIYEMATNRQLFRGDTDNEVLYNQMCTFGKLPENIILGSSNQWKHFNHVTFLRRSMPYLINHIHAFEPSNKFYNALKFAVLSTIKQTNTKEEMASMLCAMEQLYWLLQKMFELWPQFRIAIDSAIHANFITNV